MRFARAQKLVVERQDTAMSVNQSLLSAVLISLAISDAAENIVAAIRGKVSQWEEPTSLTPVGQYDILPVGRLDLSCRARRSLRRMNIETVDELCEKTPVELLAIKSFGQTNLREIQNALHKRGRNLKGVKP